MGEGGEAGCRRNDEKEPEPSVSAYMLPSGVTSGVEMGEEVVEEEDIVGWFGGGGGGVGVGAECWGVWSGLDDVVLGVMVCT